LAIHILSLLAQAALPFLMVAVGAITALILFSQIIHLRAVVAAHMMDQTMVNLAALVAGRHDLAEP
jgi:hypothetical protein